MNQNSITKELANRIVFGLVQPRGDQSEELKTTWLKYKNRAGITATLDLSKYPIKSKTEETNLKKRKGEESTETPPKKIGKLS